MVHYVSMPVHPHAAAAAHVQYPQPQGAQGGGQAPFVPFAHMQAPGFAQAQHPGVYMHGHHPGAHYVVAQQPQSIQYVPAAQRPPGPRPPPTRPP